MLFVNKLYKNIKTLGGEESEKMHHAETSFQFS